MLRLDPHFVFVCSAAIWAVCTNKLRPEGSVGAPILGGPEAPPAGAPGWQSLPPPCLKCHRPRHLICPPGPEPHAGTVSQPVTPVTPLWQWVWDVWEGRQGNRKDSRFVVMGAEHEEQRAGEAGAATPGSHAPPDLASLHPELLRMVPPSLPRSVCPGPSYWVGRQPPETWLFCQILVS